MTDTDIVIVLGTRPEIIKLAPVIRACETNGVPYSVIHTGQHYSEELDAVFFEQLELPDPDYNLGVGSDSHGVQTAAMLVGIEEILQEEKPETVLVQGDTNSVLAGAIATSKMDIDLGHVEAGLRSFDRDMPEEVNRVMTDHAADYLFAPTDDSAALIREEGIPAKRIYVTGNTVVDAVEQHREFAQKKSSVLEELELQRGEYVLMTAHRAENVDDPNRFREILSGVAQVAKRFEANVVYPIHPRAKNRIEEFDLSVPRSVRLVEPQDYLDFLNLESHARLILTDSGGVQEEACILGVPCVTMRDNTERPETIDVGANVLAGTDADEILESAAEMDRTAPDWTNPFGDGTAGERIVDMVHHSKTTEEMEILLQ
ncbi:UDP-N-acetylglucosamine 2-epimerase [Haladaptatus paucihalophilus DX253]|uniref:UDP-N-acetylglucosamine 2-epimerase n=1 Tax=Haladaptatus paucihalophilus DX253 TaxID=797209 RepID=E7QZJ2_HALPU|nr:UDP-N-acetylglucosamine 2-epimerase (non-hydrolyzing) [Haladaptatus paucihalophilus]EFW90113.1 UDP-N-acetylglucosamine 2-epimerase [Haladaptatus paucihalophilus DX253]SHL05858.1 UDP-N-acetylglucosamine 2-epimerase (non-hydrolysing) [Haladaptatus paucihalophilus DX253]